jgi:hypothetical protein
VLRGNSSNCSINTVAEFWSLGIKVGIVWLRHSDGDGDSDSNSDG